MPAHRLIAAGWPRRAAWSGVLVMVCMAHWWVAGQLPDSRFGEGAADDTPRVIEVAFVRELAPAAAPVHVATPTAAPRRSRPTQAAAPVPAASSAPVEPAAPPMPAPQPIAQVGSAPAAAAPEPLASVASAVSTPVAADLAASAPAAFDWPPSTRMSYVLEGQYRGPVYGNAKVEWLRDGSHYQVRLEVRIPPLGGRRMLSDGTLGPNGLSPRRYDEDTEIALRETLRQTVLFEPDRIVLANGKVNDLLPGAQDTASQFVQMTWLFLTRPELLEVGRTVTFPLALPRRLGQWSYDVTELVDLRLPFGEVKAYHLVPRQASRRPKEWVVETWVAPSLQYLPAKITLRLDDETYAELTLKSLPLQSAPASAAESSPARIVR
jgi:hypothetical protein